MVEGGWQISDLHLSIFQDPTRSTELMEFASVTVNNIRPAVVLASGKWKTVLDLVLTSRKQVLENI
ncbi:Transmembrane protein 62 [Portunus trituberculatus]|uniref:Transmembrane protein 62 n=1 Tax=Portunus trituberculatus TaxID=210409 RepID=A0A5B7EP25_PORTR|nr:Transmembrane protein 62 [Portunus trituberculatus]